MPTRAEDEMRAVPSGIHRSGAVGAADRRIAVWIGLAFCFAFTPLLPGHLQGTDEISVYETTRSIYERASLSVPAHQGAYEGAGGRLYSIFSVGQSVLALPFYGLGTVLRAVLPEAAIRAISGPSIRVETTVWGGTPEIFTTSLYAPFSSGFLLALFFLFERRLGVSRRASIVATLLLGTSTFVVTMSIYFLQHTTEAILVLGALFAFLHWKETGRFAALAVGSACTAGIPLIRMPASVAVIGLGLYLLHTLYVRARRGDLDREAVALAIGLPILACLSIHVAINYAKWGVLLMSPMLGQFNRMDNPLWVGIHGFLFSPGVSVFVYTPLLLLGPWTLRAMAARHRPEVLCMLFICLSFLLVCSHYELWTGLYSSPGPRYQFVWTPLLLLSLGPWLDRRPALLGRISLVALAAIGVAVQLALVLADWTNVVAAGGYHAYQPRMGFLYVWGDSPVAVAAERLYAGDLASWLVRLARGFEDEPGRPLAAIGLALLLASTSAICAYGASRNVRSARDGDTPR